MKRVDEVNPLENSKTLNQFNFYGVGVQIVGQSTAAIEFALQSFKYFQVDQLEKIDIKIYLLSHAQKPKTKCSLFRFRQAQVFGWRQRFVLYPENQSVFLYVKNKLTEVHLFSANPDFLNELVFLVISSLVGWELESRSWIRLHAVSYQHDSEATALAGDSGIGKSSYAVKCLQNGGLLFSDEITLVSPHGIVHPWPIPIQLSQELIQKFNIDINTLLPFRKRRYAMKWQLTLKNTNIASPAILTQVKTPHSPIGILLRIALGTGLPQILEFQLRLDNLPQILKIIFQRLYFVLKLFFQKKLCCNLSLMRLGEE